EDLAHKFDKLGIIVHQQHLALAAFEGIGGDAVVLHEFVERFARNAAEPGAGDPEAFELSVVETPNDGLLADLANFGRLAGREHGFHAFVRPLPNPSPNPIPSKERGWKKSRSHECGPRSVSP